jgi:hypothetical protein
MLDGFMKVQELVGKESLREEAVNTIESYWKVTEFNKQKATLHYPNLL